MVDLEMLFSRATQFPNNTAFDASGVCFDFEGSRRKEVGDSQLQSVASKVHAKLAYTCASTGQGIQELFQMVVKDLAESSAKETAPETPERFEKEFVQEIPFWNKENWSEMTLSDCRPRLVCERHGELGADSWPKHPNNRFFVCFKQQ